MSKKSAIVQFSPSTQQPDYPGVKGWGFNSHGYRFVVYGPAEWDTGVTREALAKQKKNAALHEEAYALSDQATNRIRKRNSRKKISLMRNEEERRDHGPAHLHVFHLQSGAESKLELIEHYDPEQSYVRLLPNGKHKELTPPQLDEAINIVKPRVSEFIQLWRELYQDVGTSRYVARVTKVRGIDIEHIPHKINLGRDNAGKPINEYWLEVTANNGEKTLIPPPKAHRPGRHQDKVSTRRPDGDLWSAIYPEDSPKPSRG